jgi:TolB protein
MKTRFLRINALLLAGAAAVFLLLFCASVTKATKPTGGGGTIPPPGTYSGRIVHTVKGILHIFNLATNGDTSLGVSGVNPKFSRDGSRIVYQNGGIWIMNSAASYAPQQLSATGGTPSFSPDATRIAYGDNGIWTMNADGSSKTHLTLPGHQPSYSPAGTQIAYNAAVGGNQQLFVMNADGIGARQVLTSGAVIDTVWCPGLKVVMGVLSGRYYQLSTYDPNTPGSLTTLTSSSGNNFEPSWSPDATHISWTSSGGIWIMNADGSNPRLIIAGGRQGSWGP